MKKVIIITGATRGIGLAIAHRLASDGFDIALTFRDSEDIAQDIVGEIKTTGANARCYRVDLGDLDQARSLPARVAIDFGCISGLINNAGITDDGPFIAMDTSRYCQVIRTNLIGTMALTGAALPILLAAPESVIINVSSLGGIVGKEGQVPYAASKGALIGFTRWLGRKYGSQGLRANAVAPGFVNTDMVSALRAEAYNPFICGTALHRMGESREIADAVAFLMQAGYMQNTTLRLDGGFAR